MVFLHEDKHQSFLQAGSIVFTGHGQASPYTQNKKSAKSSQYLKKEVRDEVDFLCR